MTKEHEVIENIYEAIRRTPEIVRFPSNLKTKPNDLDKCLDQLVPREEKLTSCLYINLETYLSRIAMLNRKILGVRHRKGQWDKAIRSHISKFERLAELRDVPNIKENHHLIFRYALRDVRAENEFEMFLYSVNNALSMLTRVIAAFLQGSTELHNHSKLESVLLRYGNWDKLVEIVKNAHEKWVEDLIERRNAATHYVALTAPSLYGHLKNPEISNSNLIRIAIPKTSVKSVSIWWDDIPTIGGTSTVSITPSEGEENITEIHDIRDRKGKLLIKHVGKLPSLPPMIDGMQYVNGAMTNFENYVICILQELKTKCCMKGI